MQFSSRRAPKGVELLERMLIQGWYLTRIIVNMSTNGHSIRSIRKYGARGIGPSRALRRGGGPSSLLAPLAKITEKFITKSLAPSMTRYLVVPPPKRLPAVSSLQCPLPVCYPARCSVRQAGDQLLTSYSDSVFKGNYTGKIRVNGPRHWHTRPADVPGRFQVPNRGTV